MYEGCHFTHTTISFNGEGRFGIYRFYMGNTTTFDLTCEVSVHSQESERSFIYMSILPMFLFTIFLLDIRIVFHFITQYLSTFVLQIR